MDSPLTPLLLYTDTMQHINNCEQFCAPKPFESVLLKINLDLWIAFTWATVVIQGLRLGPIPRGIAIDAIDMND